MSRIKAGWSGEAAICAFAALLAFGTLAWEEALHALALAPESVGGGAHFVRDGLLLLPLSLVAAWGGTHMWPPRRLGPMRAAAGIAGTFAVLLAPATAAPTALHAADETGLAHAGDPAGMTPAPSRRSVTAATASGSTTSRTSATTPSG